MTTLALNPIPSTGENEAPPAETKPAATVTPPAAATVATIVQKAIDDGADVSTLTRLYLKLRNSKQELDAQAKAKMAPITQGLDLIESHFLAKMNELSVDSLKNEAGTPYRANRVSITVADNGVFVDFVLSRALAGLPVSDATRDTIKQTIIDSGQLALIEARASKTAVETFLEETKELPPGLNRREEHTVNVRAS